MKSARLNGQVTRLQTGQDIVGLFERAATEVKETPTSIALANVRMGIGKARMRLEELRMKYLAFKNKHGANVIVPEAQNFFGAQLPGPAIENK